MAKIFICYRRDDSIESAGRIWGWLKVRLPEDTVFFDVQTIPPGTNFRDSVKQVILDEAEVVLVIIGKSWAGSTGADGQPRRRLFEDDDPVRQEVELALEAAREKNLPIIPVLVQNATMPTRSELPDTIATLADLNASRVRPDPDFENDMRTLRATLHQQVGDIPFASAYTYEEASRGEYVGFGPTPPGDGFQPAPVPSWGSQTPPPPPNYHYPLRPARKGVFERLKGLFGGRRG